MKYLKLIIDQTNSDVVQCADVPLGSIIPVSCIGHFNDTSKTKFFIGNNSSRVEVDQHQFIAFIFNDQESYEIYDINSNKSIDIASLNVKTWAQLIIELTLRNLIHTTDDELIEIPDSIRIIDEQKTTIENLTNKNDNYTKEISKLSKTLEEKNNYIAALEKRLAETVGKPKKTSKSWKQKIEDVFGSSGSLSCD